jgi:cell division protein FtsQ
MRVKRSQARRQEPSIATIFFQFIQELILMISLEAWKVKWLILLGFLIYWGGEWFFSPQQWQISKVKIDAPAHLGAPIKTVLTPLLEQGWLFIDQHSVEAVLKNLPTVETVKVEKIFPDKLQLQLTEFKPIARWQDISQDSPIWLVSSTGKLFRGEIHQDLPLWKGSILQLIELKEKFKESQALLETHHLKVNILQINTWGSWQLTLQNGLIVKIGKDFSRLQYFIKWYPKFPPSASTLDLRYPHGVAVGF